MAVRSEGQIRSGSDAGDEKVLAVSDAGDQYVIQGGTPYAELTRLGGGYSAITTSAVAGLVVRPGTVALFTLWNGEANGGKSYVIDRLFTHALVTGAATAFFGIWATIHPTGMTAPGADIVRSATNLTGNTGRTYNGLGQVGVGETVVDNGWYPWGRGQGAAAAAVPGSHDSVEVAGRLIVPPQGGISLHVVASTTNEDFNIGCSWYEVQLDLK